MSKRGISRPLLVTDAGLARTPVFERVASLAPGAVVFASVEPNPAERNVLDGLASYQQNRCNGIVGLGGVAVLRCFWRGGGRVGRVRRHLRRRCRLLAHALTLSADRGQRGDGGSATVR